MGDIDLAAIRAFLGPDATAENCVSARLCAEVERLRLALWKAERALDGERRSRDAAIMATVEQAAQVADTWALRWSLVQSPVQSPAGEIRALKGGG